MTILRDNPDYGLCAACGGTGWAYSCRLDENGNMVNISTRPGWTQYMKYIPCPDCRYGAAKIAGTEEEQKSAILK